MEATAADGAAGALGPKAPRAWRASDLKWRSVAQALEFAASGPRVAALHGGLQVALVETARSLQPAPIDSTGEGLAAISGVALVALFAFAAETLRTSNDDDVLRAENAAVRASLKSEDGSEALHRDDRDRGARMLNDKKIALDTYRFRLGRHTYVVIAPSALFEGLEDAAQKPELPRHHLLPVQVQP